MRKLREENLPKSLLYLFVGFAGNAVGVAQDLQLHVSLQQTTANTREGGDINHNENKNAYMKIKHLI